MLQVNRARASPGGDDGVSQPMPSGFRPADRRSVVQRLPRGRGMTSLSLNLDTGREDRPAEYKQMWDRIRLSPAIDPLIVLSVVFSTSMLGILLQPHGLLSSFWAANAVLLGLFVRMPSLATRLGWVAACLGYLGADLLMGSSLGVHPHDPLSVAVDPSQFWPQNQLDLSGLRIGVTEDFGACAVDQDIRRVFRDRVKADRKSVV